MNNEDKHEVIKLRTDQFISWLEMKFNEKYDIGLESLKERFVGIYTLFKLIFEKVLEIDQILSAETQLNDSSIYNQHKPLLDNMIRLLDMMIREFPECLDLEFVEHFFLSVEERIKIFIAHLHQIFHIINTDPNLTNKISKCTKIIDNAINLIPQSVIELQRRAELSVPLLKYIKDCKAMFRSPLKKLNEEIQILANDKSYEEFETVMEDVRNRSKGPMKFKLDFVNKMIDLVKENSQYQFEINKMLKPYYTMSGLIKTKGKKFLNENLKSTDQAKLLKFVTLLLRADFSSNVLPTVEINELVYIIKLLEAQSNLVTEYKKSLLKGVEEFQPFNHIEFEIIVEKYKLVMIEINNFQDFAMKNFELTKMNKDSINQILKDIKRVLDKYKDFQYGIYHYQDILEFFQKIRNMAGKFCFNEFNLKVELICEYNL